MANTTLDLHFSDLKARTHVVRVLTTDGRDWHLHAVIDGKQFTKHCGRWQSVERTMSWLRHHAHEPLTLDTSPPRDRRAAAGQLVAAMLLLVLTSTMAVAQPAVPDTPAVEAFIAATRDYATMHRRLEQQLPPLEVNADPQTIRRAVEAMANGLRVVRADARQGDFFTPALAKELRIRIKYALAEHGFTSEDIRFAEWLDGIEPSKARLFVNGTFPWAFGSAMFPCVISALPPLPPELQYRVVGNTLVLIDVHASLIVDLLPNALIESTVTDLDCGVFRGSAKNPRR